MLENDNRLSVFHLATDKLINLKNKKKDRKSGTDDVGDTSEELNYLEQLKTETFKLVDLFLEKMEPKQLKCHQYSNGSLLYIFCAIDCHHGVKKILSEPFLHPPDPTDQIYTPLSLSIRLGHLECAKEILLQPAPINADYLKLPEVNRTPLQTLLARTMRLDGLQLEVIKLLLNKGM